MTGHENQHVDVDVTDVAAGGDGIGHAPDGRVVFVRGGIPGDRVAVEVEEDRRRMVRGVAAGVLDASPDRVPPPCPHVADGCGGCTWQHVAVGAQRRLKVRVAEEALRRIGRLTGTVEPGPALAVGGHRTTVRGLVAGGRFAYRAVRSHDPVVVDECLVAHPALEELIREADFGAAAEVTLRVSAATGERLALFDPAVPDDLALPADVRVIGADDLRRRRRAWVTEVVHGHQLRVSAGSFFQSHRDGAAALVDAVRAAGEGRWGSGRLVDLYGGVGLFAVCLGDGMQTTCVEASRSSVADARHNLASRDAKAVRVAAERWRPDPADLVIADPPRAGLGAQVVRSIDATGAARVVLVSCDAAAFARDARALVDAGFERVRTVALDLFPHTPHVELVSRFDRVDA